MGYSNIVVSYFKKNKNVFFNFFLHTHSEKSKRLSHWLYVTQQYFVGWVLFVLKQGDIFFVTQIANQLFGQNWVLILPVDNTLVLAWWLWGNMGPKLLYHTIFNTSASTVDLLLVAQRRFSAERSSCRL